MRNAINCDDRRKGQIERRSWKTAGKEVRFGRTKLIRTVYADGFLQH